MIDAQRVLRHRFERELRLDMASRAVRERFPGRRAQCERLVQSIG